MKNAKLEIRDEFNGFKRLYYTYEHNEIKHAVASPIFKVEDMPKLIDALFHFTDQLISKVAPEFLSTHAEKKQPTKNTNEETKTSDPTR